VDLHSFNEPLNCGIASARSAPLDAFFEGWKGRGDFEYSKREMARIVMGKPAMKDRNPFGSHQIMWYQAPYWNGHVYPSRRKRSFEKYRIRGRQAGITQSHKNMPHR
jgi:hypothetical protein